MSMSSNAALVVAVANGPLSGQRVNVPNGLNTARPTVVLSEEPIPRSFKLAVRYRFEGGGSATLPRRSPFV